jgi:hypothetical protein
MPIEKSKGQTPTEQTLARLCDRTFLKVWSYANPFKPDGKELCDLIAVFENHVILFFDRECRKFDGDVELQIAWRRWYKETISKQIATVNGAKRYLLDNADEVYLDAKCTTKLPIAIPTEALVVHKVIVAHGAAEACVAASEDNVSGSLAVIYELDFEGEPLPFVLRLDRRDPVHVLDSHNLGIILSELDTFADFVQYLTEKERAISRYDTLVYCGEEDLLAHYLLNFDEELRKHFIGTKDKSINGLMIGEGEWNDFYQSGPYKRRLEANKVSMLWDELIQKTGQNALDGKLLGNGDVFSQRSALHEMAKEPRLSRRMLSEGILNAMRVFPDSLNGITRHIVFMPSYFEHTGYVFLQVKSEDYDEAGDEDYRPMRQTMLQIACGVVKCQHPNLHKVIGIGMDAVKHSPINSEDLILLECKEWTEEQQKHYEGVNTGLNFLATSSVRRIQKTASEFPPPPKYNVKAKVGRNQPCHCGSGKKYKKCCLSNERL